MAFNHQLTGWAKTKEELVFATKELFEHNEPYKIKPNKKKTMFAVFVSRENRKAPQEEILKSESKFRKEHNIQKKDLPGYDKG
jgi:hypothetical protein